MDNIQMNATVSALNSRVAMLEGRATATTTVMRDVVAVNEKYQQKIKELEGKIKELNEEQERYENTLEEMMKRIDELEEKNSVSLEVIDEEEEDESGYSVTPASKTPYIKSAFGMERQPTLYDCGKYKYKYNKRDLMNLARKIEQSNREGRFVSELSRWNDTIGGKEILFSTQKTDGWRYEIFEDAHGNITIADRGPQE